MKELTEDKTWDKGTIARVLLALENTLSPREYTAFQYDIYNLHEYIKEKQSEGY
jgi:hypothetical protein